MKRIIVGLTIFLLVISAWARTFQDDFEDGNLDGWEVGVQQTKVFSQLEFAGDIHFIAEKAEVADPARALIGKLDEEGRVCRDACVFFPVEYGEINCGLAQVEIDFGGRELKAAAGRFNFRHDGALQKRAGFNAQFVQLGRFGLDIDDVFRRLLIFRVEDLVPDELCRDATDINGAVSFDARIGDVDTQFAIGQR